MTPIAGEDLEKPDPLIHCWWEHEMAQPSWQTVLPFLKKLNYDTFQRRHLWEQKLTYTQKPAGDCPRRQFVAMVQRHGQSPDGGGIFRKPMPSVFNWQLPEDVPGTMCAAQCGLANPPHVPVAQTTQMPFKRSIHCGTPYWGMLLSNKNQAIIIIDYQYNTLGGSQWNYAEQKSSSRKATCDRSRDMETTLGVREQKGGGCGFKKLAWGILGLELFPSVCILTVVVVTQRSAADEGAEQGTHAHGHTHKTESKWTRENARKGAGVRQRPFQAGILYYYARCYHWRKLGKGHTGTLYSFFFFF